MSEECVEKENEVITTNYGSVELVVGKLEEDGQEKTLVAHRVIDGDYKGIIFMFDNVNFVDNGDGTSSPAPDIRPQILENPNEIYFEKDSREIVEFQMLMDDVLVQFANLAIAYQRELEDEQAKNSQ